MQNKTIMALFCTFFLSSLCQASPLFTCVVEDGSRNIILPAQDLLDLKIVNGEIRTPMNSGQYPFDSMRLQIAEKRAFSLILKPSTLSSRLDLDTQEIVWNMKTIEFELSLAEIWEGQDDSGQPVAEGLHSDVTFKQNNILLSLSGTGLSHYYKVKCHKR